MPLHRGVDRFLRLRPARARRVRPWHRVGTGLERLEPRVLLAGPSQPQSLFSVTSDIPLAAVVQGVAAGTGQDEWTIGSSSGVQPAPVPQAGNTLSTSNSVTNGQTLSLTTAGGTGTSTGFEVELPGVYVSAGMNMDPAALGAALQSAAPLPAASHLALADTLEADKPLDLYRIPVEPGASSSMQISLEASAPSRWLPGQVWLVDNEGEVLALWRVPPHTASLSLSLQFTPDFHESSIVFGVSRGEASTSNVNPQAAPSFFELAVARSEGPAADAPLAQSSVPAAPPPLFVPLIQGANGQSGSGMTMLAGIINGGAGSSMVPAAPAPPSDFGSISGSIGSVINPGQLGVGPLPARSAAPSGGTLADGDPVPPVDQLDELMVDVSLLDLLPPRTGWLSRVSTADFAAPAAEQAGLATSGPLVSLEGSGGFPLLAASLREGQRALTPQASPLELEALLSTLPLVEPAAAACGATDHACPVPANVLNPGQLADLKAGSRLETARRRRGRVVVGLNVAATLAFGLLLPDLVAALQQIEPRRPLPRMLRKRGKPPEDA